MSSSVARVSQSQMQVGRPMIVAEGVCMSWGGKTVLSDINLTVNSNDFIAVTGPNGGGKSTLLKILLRLLKPTSGSVKYFCADGVLTETLSIGYLPQKNMVDSHFPITVREVIGSGLLSLKLDRSEKANRVERMLQRVELTSHADAPIGALSGGQLQRTLLGRALISNPGLIVLDEPLSYLDKHFEQHVYNILEQEAQQAAILLVSHEMSVIATMANRHLIVDHTLHECAAKHHYFVSECQ